MTGEGRADFFRAWGPGFEQEGAGGGTRGATQSVCENYKSFKWTNLTVVEGMHKSIMYILFESHTSVERAECSKGWGVWGVGGVEGDFQQLQVA